MEILAILSAIKEGIAIISAVAKTGQDVAPFVKAILDFINKKEQTPEDAAALKAKLKELEDELDLPLPPPEPGEED